MGFLNHKQYQAMQRWNDMESSVCIGPGTAVFYWVFYMASMVEKLESPTAGEIMMWGKLLTFYSAPSRPFFFDKTWLRIVMISKDSEPKSFGSV